MTKSKIEINPLFHANKSMQLKQQKQPKIDKSERLLRRNLWLMQRYSQSSRNPDRDNRNKLTISEHRRFILAKRLASKKQCLQDLSNNMKETEQELESSGTDLSEIYNSCANVNVTLLKKQIADLETVLETCCDQIHELQSWLAGQGNLSDEVVLDFRNMGIADGINEDCAAHQKS